MFGRIGAIALNTFRESVRARILLGLAGVAFAVAAYSVILGAYTLRQGARVVSDIGSASMSLFGIGVAVIIGATSLHRELEMKTIFPILARPISRAEYVVGKYFGTLLTILVFLAANAGFLLFIEGALGGRAIGLVLGLGLALVAAFGLAAWRSADARTFGAIPFAIALCVLGVWLAAVVPEERRVILGSGVLSFLEIGIVAGFATLFASFSSPFLSAIFTVGILLIGRSADGLARMPEKYFGPTIPKVAAVVAKVVPNLQVYVPARPLLTGEALDAHLPSYVGLAALNALGWAVALLAVAAIVFRRRDFL